MEIEFIERRHNNPDYELDVHITGVRMGNTGKVHWKISMDKETDTELAAEILDRAAKVLRKTDVPG